MCDNAGDDGVCSWCSRKLKFDLLDAVAASEKYLLDAHFKSKKENAISCYCFKCASMFHVLDREHEHHKDFMVRVDVLSNSVVAWVTGKEKWALLFKGILVCRMVAFVVHIFLKRFCCS